MTEVKQNRGDSNYIVNPWITTAKEASFGSPEYTGGYYFPKPVSDFNLFSGTPFEITIPVNQKKPRPEVLKEISSLTPDILTNEPYQNFYRHIDMLPRFATGDQIAPLLPAVLKRLKEARDFSSQVIHDNEKSREEVEMSVYARASACLETCEQDSNLRLPKEVVKLVYEDALSIPPLIPFAIIFDRRNKMYGEAIDVAGRLKENVEQNFNSEEKKGALEDILTWVPWDPELFPSFLVYSLTRANSEVKTIEIVQEFANVGGVEQIRKALRGYVIDNPSFEPIFKTIFEFFGFDPKNPLHDLKEDVYEKIDFSEYQPNKETNEFEIKLLKEEFGKHQNLLDVACGTGRHLIALDGEDGRHVTGIDVVQKHIDYIKSKKPNADAKVGSWFNLPDRDGKFDGVYCLGRSLTHNTTIPDTVAALKEMGRVLKDDGKLIVDMPDSRYGDVHQDILKTEVTRRLNGLTDYLEETIVDSPDNIHYFDRYVPVPLRFRFLAFLAGFYTEKIAEQKYHSVSGNENVNIYWRLTKRPLEETLSVEDKNSIIRFIAGHGDNKTLVGFGVNDDNNAIITDTYSRRNVNVQLGPK